MSEERYVNLFDIHWGTERVNGHLKTLHDEGMLDSVLTFMSDFKPHYLNIGGDALDCGAVSHWNKGRARQVEGVRLLKDAEGLRTQFLKHAMETQPQKGAKRTYIKGNHEDWIDQWVDQNPTLEGIVDLERLLGLDKDHWNIVEVGGAYKMGQLYLIHGDQFKPNQTVAKKAVEVYQRNVHFGHHHTHQVHTNVTPLDDAPKQGVAVPCLCKRNPGYAEGQPNRWLQGFEYGYLQKDGTFHNQVVLRIDGKFVADGKIYR